MQNQFSKVMRDILTQNFNSKFGGGHVDAHTDQVKPCSCVTNQPEQNDTERGEVS